MWKLSNSNLFAIALIYIAFFSLIAYSVYFLNSGNPLWALLLTPDFEIKKDKQQ